MIGKNIKLKALYSLKCVIMYFRTNLNKEFDLEKSGNFICLIFGNLVQLSTKNCECKTFLKLTDVYLIY